MWAGGFSNLVDRLAYGKVFDFFNLGFGAVRTGTSNLADVAIMAGIPLIAIGWWRTKQEQETEQDQGNGDLIHPADSFVEEVTDPSPSARDDGEKDG